MPGVPFKIKISESKLIFINANGDIQEEGNEAGELGAVYGLVSALNQYARCFATDSSRHTPLAGFGLGNGAKSWVEVMIAGGFGQGIGLINSGEKGYVEVLVEPGRRSIYTHS